MSDKTTHSETHFKDLFIRSSWFMLLYKYSWSDNLLRELVKLWKYSENVHLFVEMFFKHPYVLFKLCEK